MNAPMTPDRPVCTQEAARAAGLDVAPSPEELLTTAESIVTLWGDRWAEPDATVASLADSGAQLARAMPLVLAEVERLRLGMAGLHARITELEAPQAAVIAERDAQIIAWLVKKAGEEGTSNKESRTKADAIFRLADKLSRGAVRPPLSKGPDAVEYGIRLTPDGPDNEVLNYRGAPHSTLEDRLNRHRASYPNAQLLQRTVHHGQWTDVPTP